MIMMAKLEPVDRIHLFVDFISLNIGYILGVATLTSFYNK